MAISRRETILGITSLSVASASLVSCGRQQPNAQTSPEMLLQWKRGQRLTRIKDSSLSREGRYGAFSRLDTENSSIAVVDFETTATVSIAFGAELAKVEDVMISADGKRIACIVHSKPAGPDGSGGYGQSEIWVMNTAGIVELRLTGQERQKARPFFSPDGEKLVFFADMKHQYLDPDELRLYGSESGSLAVHELNLESKEITLIDLPILPIPRGAFYTDANTIVATWSQDVEDPEFDRLPANCVCGYPDDGTFGGNFWQRIRPRFDLTVGESQLLEDNKSSFQKFEMTLPPFASVRDTFWITNSAAENGFLGIVTFYDASQDPSPSLLKYRSYRSPDAPKRVLSWLTREGGRDDIALPSQFEGLLGASGSFNKKRIMVWESVSVDRAKYSLFPWTHSEETGWEIIDIRAKYIPTQTLDAKIYANTVNVEIPKLIDKNGVGATMETKSPAYGVRKAGR